MTWAFIDWKNSRYTGVIRIFSPVRSGLSIFLLR